jgi:hypothetical protein
MNAPSRAGRAVSLLSLVFAWACLAILGLPKTAQAEAVGEAWRGGGFSGPQSVSVNTTDGSGWVADSLNSQE